MPLAGRSRFWLRQMLAYGLVTAASAGTVLMITGREIASTASTERLPLYEETQFFGTSRHRAGLGST